MVSTDGKGHAGLNLLITSLAAYLLGYGTLFANAVILLSTLSSTLPDIDLRLELPHRKYTHNILFALLSGSAAGLLTHLLGLSFSLGFYSVCIGVLTHLLGDLMTYRSFTPLYPVLKVRVALRLFHSNNRQVNSVILLAGMASYVTYLLRYVVGPYITTHELPPWT